MCLNYREGIWPRKQGKGIGIGVGVEGYGSIGVSGIR